MHSEGRIHASAVRKPFALLLCRGVVRAVVAGANLNLPYSSDAAKMLVKDTNLLAQAMNVDPLASIGVITALHSACHVSPFLRVQICLSVTFIVITGDLPASIGAITALHSACHELQLK